MGHIVSQRLYGVLIVVVTLGFGGCIATPQPNPPNIDVEIDLDKVFTEAINNWGGVDIFGDPGAIKPPESTLRVYDLDNSDLPVDEAVEEDGSFHVEIDGSYGDAYRLQAILDDERSEAFDIIAEFDGMRPLPKPLESCFITTPSTWTLVREGEPETVELRNDCDESVTVTALFLRFEPSSFAIREAPTEVHAHSRASVVVEYVPGLGDSEEILMVELASILNSEVDRRPITLVLDR